MPATCRLPRFITYDVQATRNLKVLLVLVWIVFWGDHISEVSSKVSQERRESHISVQAINASIHHHTCDYVCMIVCILYIYTHSCSIYIYTHGHNIEATVICMCYIYICTYIHIYMVYIRYTYTYIIIYYIYIYITYVSKHVICVDVNMYVCNT